LNARCKTTTVGKEKPGSRALLLAYIHANVKARGARVVDRLSVRCWLAVGVNPTRVLASREHLDLCSRGSRLRLTLRQKNEVYPVVSDGPRWSASKSIQSPTSIQATTQAPRNLLSLSWFSKQRESERLIVLLQPLLLVDARRSSLYGCIPLRKSILPQLLILIVAGGLASD
jgi:hypothetical protein